MVLGQVILLVSKAVPSLLWSCIIQHWGKCWLR